MIPFQAYEETRGDSGLGIIARRKKRSTTLLTQKFKLRSVPITPGIGFDEIPSPYGGQKEKWYIAFDGMWKDR